MKYFAKTDKGTVRETNEDHYNIISGYPDIPVSFIIADGMGGHNAGEIASRSSVDFISKIIMQSPGLFSDSPEVNIRNIIIKANRFVYEKSFEISEYHGMGTTLIIAVFIGNVMYIGHVGDSRVYLVRSEHIKRVTNDHSYIEELIRNGSLTRKEAENHPNKNVITRALGCSTDLEVDTYICELEKDDCIVMCTDGLQICLMKRKLKILL